MKKALYFALLVVFSLGYSQPIVAEHNSHEKTVLCEDDSASTSDCSSCCQDEKSDLCRPSTTSSWLNRTWISVTTWVTNLFDSIKKGKETKQSSSIIPEEIADSEEENIPFKDNQ